MTLAKRIVACLDVDGGRVVKGINFVALRDAGDPAELAARYDADLADELVFLDITASSDDRDILLDAVRRTADSVFIPLTVPFGMLVDRWSPKWVMALAALVTLAVTNAVVLLAPMGCGSMAPLGKLF